MCRENCRSFVKLLYIFERAIEISRENFRVLSKTVKVLYRGGFVVYGMLKSFPIMLALCFMLSSLYYAENYAGIINTGLFDRPYMQLRHSLKGMVGDNY